MTLEELKIRYGPDLMNEAEQTLRNMQPGVARSAKAMEYFGRDAQDVMLWFHERWERRILK